MNVLQKVLMIAVFGALAAASNAAPANVASVAGVTVPEVSATTAKIADLIAKEVTAQMQNAIDAPRQPRIRRSPSVTIVDGELVVVEARRLPPLDGIEDGGIRTAQAQHSVRF